MECNFSGIGVDISTEVRSYLDKKLEHVEKFMHTDATYKLDGELRYSSGIDDKKQKYHAAFTLVTNGTSLNAQADGQSAHEAIDIASAELAREVAAYKSKNKSLVRRGALKAKKFLQGFKG